VLTYLRDILQDTVVLDETLEIMSHRYLILGLLMESPMSGYDIKKRVQSALGAATQASYGTLYPMLHKLLAEGAVEVQEIEQQRRPSKKIYRITEWGKHEVYAWLKQPAAADQIRREFLLKLYLARHLPPRDMLAIVTARREETEAMLKDPHADKDGRGNAQQAWMMDYVQAMCQAEIDWLKRIERQIAVAKV
jgi:DNA-binding PadR family transcriptional regulator